MSEATLLALALAVHDAHARLADEVRGSSEEARFLVEETARRLELLVAHLRRREEEIQEVRDALADRMNNLLMSIKTTSDLLRAGSGEEARSRACEHLDSAVDSGRTSVRRLREALARLR
jgi:hypothetical protein